MAKGPSLSKGLFDMRAIASGYLVDGESIMWQGKPATIFILGRGLLLFILALIVTVCVLLTQNDVGAWAIAVVASLLMILVDRLYGLIIAIASIIVVGLDVANLLGNPGVNLIMAVPLFLSLIYLFVNTIYLTRVLFIITDQRIITRYGIFSLRYAELDIDRIQNVTIIQPWYERFFGYGDVVFATAGEQGGIDYQKPGIKLMSGGAVSWENVSRPFEVIKRANEVIHSKVSQQKEKGTFVPSTPSAATDAEERLRQLSELSTKGLISQQEYQEKREEILRKL